MKSAILLLSLSIRLFGQTATLRGVVTDESGAVVPNATVTLNSATGTKSANTSGEGAYSITAIPPGEYTVQVSAPGLAQAQSLPVALQAGLRILNIEMKVAAISEHVNVEDASNAAVTPEPANNASALVLRGDDLQALADDPTDLAADLQALAGPAAGPNGGEVYIDGFSGGQLPSKDSIREIRINQNPFSPEYDKLGFGRIEILTKPGTDKFRGTAFYNFADDIWNSRNPYAARKAPFLLREYGGNLSGPVTKSSSFFLDIRRDATDNGSIINAIILDPGTLAVVPFNAVYRAPQRNVRVSPRFDYQLNTNNTLSVRYAMSRADIPGLGIGSFNLTSRGYDSLFNTQTAQVTETAVLGASMINEIRFQFFRSAAESLPATTSPTIQVLGSFNGGGAGTGHAFDILNSYEFQDYVSVIRGAHSWRFGARLRGQTVASVSPQNFAGTFTFGGGQGPELDAKNQIILDAAGQPVTVPIQSIEQYRRTLLFTQLGYSPQKIRALGGGASQFSIASGLPGLSAGQFDLGTFAGDDWRLRPNLTVSAGLRYETQTNIHDWYDFAPRLGFAWAPGKGAKSSRAKTVLRGGFGMFYDRFALANTLAARRFNGTVQQQWIVTNPDFYPTVPSISSLAGIQSTQVIEKVSASLRAPYIMQSALSVERQFPMHTTIAVTYANSHGLHMLRSRDINAPLPGSGAYPFGSPDPIFLMESAGLYNQNQLIVNTTARISPNLSFFSGYMLNRALSNTDGLNTFPANPYDLRGEYGPAATDIRHRMSLGGSLNTRWNVRLSPFVIVESGPPFDITAGQDLYGTTLFNARPAIATDINRPGVIATAYGLLDPNPVPGEPILPRNYGRGPGQILVNLRLSKTIGFGRPREGAAQVANSPQGGPSRSGSGGPFGNGGLQSIFGPSPTSRPYNLILSVSARNIINHNNPGAIIGNITSPLFGQANQSAGSRDPGGGGFSESANNRRFELQLRFTF